MFKLLKLIDSDVPSPLMLEIPPYARGMEPDSEVVEKRAQVVAALIQEMGAKYVGHPEYRRER